MILQKQEINLIITDYCMPEMTGYDLLKRVKVFEALHCDSLGSNFLLYSPFAGQDIEIPVIFRFSFFLHSFPVHEVHIPCFLHDGASQSRQYI